MVGPNDQQTAATQAANEPSPVNAYLWAGATLFAWIVAAFMAIDQRSQFIDGEVDEGEAMLTTIAALVAALGVTGVALASILAMILGRLIHSAK